MQQKIQLLRFGGYVGVSINGLLVPILIFQLTGSAAFAGFSMLIEWLPKLFLYITGGRIAARWQPASAHIGLDLIRVLVLISLYLCSTGTLPVWIIALAAATYQCTNAVSNILFENLVTRWWSSESATSGHTLLMKRDVESGLIVLILGLILKEPSIILIVAILLQTLVLIATIKWSRLLHWTTQPDHEPLSKIFHRITKDFKYLPGTGLLPLAFMGLGLGLPAALFYSALPFYLAHAESSWNTPDLIFAFGLVKTVLSLISLNMVQRHLKSTYLKPKHMVYAGFAILLIGCTAIGLNISYTVIAGALWLAISGSFCIPWSRTKRQELLPENPDLRLSLTGILIATEALSYLLAAGILLVFNSQLTLAMVLALSITISSIWLAYKNKLFAH